MKFLSVILPFYFLLLAVIPALEESFYVSQVECCKDQCSDMEEEHDQGSEKDCDYCNPFLVCSCYSGFFPTNNSIELFNTEIFQSAQSVYRKTKPSSAFSSFWQPPKLVVFNS